MKRDKHANLLHLNNYFKKVFHNNTIKFFLATIQTAVCYLAPQYLLVFTNSCRVVFLLGSLFIQIVEIKHIYYFMYFLTTNAFYIIETQTRTQCFGFKLWKDTKV